MSYKYDEKNSVIENNVLSRLNYFINESKSVKYTNDNGFQTLKFITWDIVYGGFGPCGDFWEYAGGIEKNHRTIAEIIKNKNDRPKLFIGGKAARLTPLIIQKLEELLYKYKLQDNTVFVEFKTPDYKGIIDTEQTHPVYKSCAGLRSEKQLTKKFDPYIVLVPKGTELYRMINNNDMEEYEYEIPLSKFERKVTRFLFNKGEMLAHNERVPVRADDGKIHVNINGNDFSFYEMSYAYHFSDLFGYLNDACYASKLGGQPIYIKCLPNKHRSR